MSKEESNAASGLTAKVDKKRKRNTEEEASSAKDAATPAANNGTTPAGPSTKKQKNRQKLKEKKKQKAKEESGDVQEGERKEGIDESIGKMDGRLLVDHFAQKAKRHNKELTAVELNDLSVPGVYFSDHMPCEVLY